jgi:cold-inducible RNA-binding protein
MYIEVSPLSDALSAADVRQKLQAFGQVTAVILIQAKSMGECRGFGFVEMPAQAKAQSASLGLKGQGLNGRALSVAVAERWSVALLAGGTQASAGRPQVALNRPLSGLCLHARRA